MTSDLKLQIEIIFSWIEEIKTKMYHYMYKTTEKEPNHLII